MLTRGNVQANYTLCKWENEKSLEALDECIVMMYESECGDPVQFRAGNNRRRGVVSPKVPPETIGPAIRKDAVGFCDRLVPQCKTKTSLAYTV